MGLGANEEGMHLGGQFQNLHNRITRRFAAEDHAVFFEDRHIFGVDFVAVAETQTDALLFVEEPPGEGVGSDLNSMAV
jgi:hypothetical protein